MPDAFSRVTVDYNGIGRYLRTSEDLRAALLAYAEVGVAHAKALAPVGPARDKHQGQFRDSISAHTRNGPGGFIEAQITAAPVWVEFGRTRTDRYQGSHTLYRTKVFLNSPKRSA